jgi:hypothetical protein
VAETIILQPEDSIVSAKEKFSISGLMVLIFVRKMQLPARGLVLDLVRIPTSCGGIWISFEKFQLPAGGLRSA